jgi:uncharacterized protein (TIGR00369 family)
MTNADLAHRQQQLVALFERAPIKRTFGMLLHYEGESAVFDLPYNAGLDHAMGGIHGGVFATLLDNAGWFSAAAFYSSWIATVDLHVRLLEPVSGKALVARGRVVRHGKRLAMADMEVRTADGELVATGTGSFAVTSGPSIASP